MIDWVFGTLVAILVDWLLIATGRWTLRAISLGRWDGSEEAFLWKRTGDRVYLGCLPTVLASFAAWIVIGLAIATILARHTPG